MSKEKTIYQLNSKACSISEAASALWTASAKGGDKHSLEEKAGCLLKKADELISEILDLVEEVENALHE